MKAAIVLVTLLALAGCAAKGAPVSVVYELDKYGVAFPIVNGQAHQMTDDERRKQVQLIVNEYCPAD